MLVFILITVIIILSFGLYQKTTQSTCVSRRRLEGKTVIVTGGTAGIGLITTTDLAHRGAKVIIACPFEEEGIIARNLIVKETENENVIFKHLNLASFKSTREFAADILKTEDRLDILINNAGVGVPVGKITKDGVHLIMQINYYSTFLLIILLLPLLKKTGKPEEFSRILTTTSCLHILGQINNAQKGSNIWKRIRIYANNKIYLLYFANELTERLKGTNVVINNVDPGIVGTTIFDSINKVIGSIVTMFCLILFKTPWDGAQTTLHAALDKNAGKVSGAYFKDCKIYKAVKRVYCDKIAKVVWEHSVRLVKLTEDELKCVAF